MMNSGSSRNANDLILHYHFLNRLIRFFYKGIVDLCVYVFARDFKVIIMDLKSPNQNVTKP